jgi:hypothetical protein
MYELIYYSVALENTTETTIENILKEARELNAKNNITGCLLYHNSQFLQILEGEKEAVKDLFLKIASDNRHEDIMLMEEGEKEERHFTGWHMAYHQLTANDFNTLDRQLFINNFSKLSDLVQKPSEVVRLFLYMSKAILTE